MRSLFATISILTLLFGASASAIEVGAFNLDGHITGGYSDALGTYGAFGVDFYYIVEENIAVGVGGYYAAGTRHSGDREIGVGPFASYTYPFLEFLSIGAREDLDYLDSRYSTDLGNGSWNTQSEYGMISFTSVGLNIHLSRNLGIGVGYRWALSLASSDIASGRSGVYFGIGLGF
jgi:hypothetical protein